MDKEGQAKLENYLAKFMAASSGQSQTQSQQNPETTPVPDRTKQMESTTNGQSEAWSPECKKISSSLKLLC
jgi:3-deoxy-7-phosphoheptulonate synthase